MRAKPKIKAGKAAKMQKPTMPGKGFAAALALPLKKGKRGKRGAS